MQFVALFNLLSILKLIMAFVAEYFPNLSTPPEDDEEETETQKNNFRDF